MKKINIAELLKNCPKGMELDCVLWDNVTFHSVDYSSYSFPIRISVNGFINFLTKEGYYHNNTRISPKCIIFPKGKDTWEGFTPPCSEFKDGDVVTYKYEQGLVSMILRKFVNFVEVHFHCALYNNEKGFITDNYIIGEPKYVYHATEEEKEKLFKEIEKNGYRWNFHAKRLEKLIEPKFKEGDKVRKKGDSKCYIIEDECTTFYTLTSIGHIDFTDQDNWELVPDKFPITTLKPYDKVLVRSVNSEKWKCDFFSNYEETYLCKFKCVGCNYQYCIPYKGNEHLLGTTDDCSEFYKTWEE